MQFTPLHPRFTFGPVFRLLVALTLIAGVAASSLVSRSELSQAASSRATDTVNLRSGPGKNYRVILVIPAGAPIKITGSYSKGFYPVRYQGTKGWIHEDYLAMPRPLGPARTTDSVKLRAGPGTKYAVILTISDGASLSITGSMSKSFYPVRYQGTKGWVHADYLAPGSGGGVDNSSDDAVSRPRLLGPAHTMDELNLRSGPGKSYGVILLMPEGASLKITGSYRKGYYPVRYQGIKGWASADYLALGSAGNGSWTTDEITDLIWQAATYYGQNYSDMLRVAKCESNLDPNNVTPPRSASGLFQFLPSTWKTTPYADRDIFDPEANAYAAAWMWSVGRRSEWTCQ